MMKALRLVFIFSTIAATIYLLWGFKEKKLEQHEIDLHLKEISEIGEDHHKGNLVGIQPFMETADYANFENFYEKIDQYFSKAQKEYFFDEKTVVVLPEHIGTWLVALDENPEVYYKYSFNAALRQMSLDNFKGLMNKDVSPLHKQKILNKKLFALKAERMAKIYGYVFSSMAKKYDVTVVAGSITLPDPKIVDGKLTVGEKGHFYNVSVIYGPDGKAYSELIINRAPVHQILSFVSEPENYKMPVFDLPTGKTGVLISHDSFYGEHYERFAQMDVDCILVPSCMIVGRKNKKDGNGLVKQQLPPSLLEIEWIDKAPLEDVCINYALAAKMKVVGVENGFNVFFRGNIWDLETKGHSIVINEGEVTKGFQVEGSSIINVWM
ncbi:nitrilase-related carbon-nitrogen hydrolase [Flammeovirgaceae bacterium SG7u.111]|nr:nitrilase-related carbon-nitrogen hydrolase [Flammeovirgaceae bacterium SG7u.132]WPO34301.1 nitrilase-related carbon-nitrogen hydrolase [Flammeovirgaceae bacterium SG7u.111]